MSVLHCRMAIVLVLLVTAAGCDSGSAGNSTPDAAGADSSPEDIPWSWTLDVALDASLAQDGVDLWGSDDADVAGGAEDMDTSGPVSDLGEPCEDNGDCACGFCVPSDIGDLCTCPCMDDCPEGWSCKGVAFAGPDVVFLCMPSLETVCEQRGVCEPGAQVEEPCGNCGLRTRACGENCLWSPWSDCAGEGPCKAGIAEEEPCEACGTRARTCAETCTWGEWSECEGTGTCFPGNLETEDCGLCGERSRSCTAECEWSAWGPCTGEGVCTPGDEEVGACGACGVQEHVCNDSCHWGTWSPCEGAGVCVPGEAIDEPCGLCGTRSKICGDLCVWGAFGACEGEGECAPLTEESCGLCGTRTCSGACQWNACDIGPVDQYEDNDIQWDPAPLPDMTDAEGDGEMAIANLNPEDDEDWYIIHIEDTIFHSTDPDFELTIPQGQVYRICVDYDCDEKDKIISGCQEGPGFIEVSLDVDDCGDFLSLDNDSGTATIHIEAITEGSCETYQLAVES